MNRESNDSHDNHFANTACRNEGEAGQTTSKEIERRAVIKLPHLALCQVGRSWSWSEVHRQTDNCSQPHKGHIKVTLQASIVSKNVHS